jgi:hypothetical protein
MLIETTQRTEHTMSPIMQKKFDEQLQHNISRCIGADRQTIDRRLRELDREWNIERMIETEAPAMIGLGIALGVLAGRKWFSISAMAAGMVILHNLQGWYPWLPLLRSLGVRTQQEIEQERMALKVLRGDHAIYQTDTQSDTRSPTPSQAIA